MYLKNMIKQSESKIQSDCFLWFHNNYCLKNHTPRYFMYVVPNEIASLVGGVLKGFGVSNTIVTKVVSMVVSGLRAVGLKDGVSDNVILAPNKVWHIEFKVEGNYQQDNQKEFESIVTNLGHEYRVIKSVDAFKELVLNEIVKDEV